MKFKIERRPIRGEYNEDGSTRVEEIRTPVLPRDWRRSALRAVLGTAVALTAIAITWSTWSIGSLLSGPDDHIGYLAALIFDLGWITLLLLEYLARYDEERRRLPQRLGWGMLVVTMVAIGWHGIEQEQSIAMGVIGAAVSLFSKLLWIAIAQHTTAKLTDRDRDRIAEARSAAFTEAAIAEVMRETEGIKQRAMLEHLAREAERRQVAEAFGLEAPAVEELAPAEQDQEPTALPAPSLADMGKSEAIRYVQRHRPELAPAEIADVLAEYGVETNAQYVAQALARGKKAEPEPTAEVIELRK